MERLICATGAYKILKGDASCGKLSHAYMLCFDDVFNLRAALKIFAREFFPEDKFSLIEQESLADLKIYPEGDGKLTAEIAADIVEGCAIKPVRHDKKLYVISEFDSASPVFQNKLLKVLEEPPEGVHFLLGATSLSPVLSTVKSRVKLLEIPPFTEEEIFSALERQGANEKNRVAASVSGGRLGTAQSVLNGDWYSSVESAAKRICSAHTLSAAATLACEYADFKYKKELLAAVQREYFSLLRAYSSGASLPAGLTAEAVSFAVRGVDKALADMKFNANFPSLLFNLLTGIAQKCAVGADSF